MLLPSPRRVLPQLACRAWRQADFGKLGLQWLVSWREKGCLFFIGIALTLDGQQYVAHVKLR